ncbi:hypothetical protein EXU57_15310 [Segetibacter sp. 3557_3]|uniref:DUF922 domain-containing protein n=1 Tax=Segetibacter sp. 3557_3 TaxID=2547429 RepID=UPI001059127B|nr:hypothetical protein [Segetibacter sp. 3557_3]TDH24181.1 hypothetical protein EXU57_15310 [Segetibacter sp. 3557_3]
MSRLVLTLLTLIACFATYGQEHSKRWIENPLLQWADFEGEVKDTSRFDAECFANVTYDYVFYSPNEFQFEVYANFDRYNSWRKKEMQSDELLRHEQLHFNIAQLFADRLKFEFENYIYSENYEAEIEEIFDKVKAAYHDMQNLYDEETNHSLNKEKQEEWEEYINDQLYNSKVKMEVVYQDLPMKTGTYSAY